MTLTAVSLFAGVGGFDLAMERAGIDVVATVELDPAARAVLTRHFPSSRHISDIQEVTGEQLRDAGFVPDRGLLVGGFPCQDLSIAGARAGLAGRRSGLYWEIVRLVDELRPRWLVLENVPGLLSSRRGRDFGAILGSLVERGYGVGYRILDAQHFGLAQRRRRVFIVGHLGDNGRTPFEVLALAQGVSGDSSPGTTPRPRVANALTRSLGSGGADDNDAQSGHLIAQTLTSHHARNRASDEVLVAHTLRAEYDASEDGTGRGTPLVPVLLTMREGKPGGGKGPLVSEGVSLTLATGNGQVLVRPVAFHQKQDPISGPVSPALGAKSDGMGVTSADSVRRLTPLECERLQGFPDGWTAEGSNGSQADSSRYRQMGNAVAVPVAEWVMRRIVAADE